MLTTPRTEQEQEVEGFELMSREVRENTVSDFMCDSYVVSIYRCKLCGELVEEIRKSRSDRLGHVCRQKDKMMEFDDVNQNLVILMEECAEVIKIASKILRFGIDNYSPSEDKLNYVALEQELGDVQAMVDILIDNNIGISKEGIQAATKSKTNKLVKYYTRVVDVKRKPNSEWNWKKIKEEG